MDDYAVRDRVHASRLSEVYTATRRRDGLDVVLKHYLGSSSDAAARAQHEFDLLRRIDDRSVARAVEVCVRDGRAVLVLERFPGYPLSTLLQGPGLDLAAKVSIALAATRALAAVHEARIIHKDIKLDNFMIDPARLDLCLIDFGFSAEFGRAERATTTQGEGTVAYIAPEQTGRLGLGIDFRTDLYSLGASLYELLTGEPPFPGLSLTETITAHITQMPQPAIDRERSVPLTLSRILDKLLEKDPEQRYQTARGLAADLELCQKQLLERGEIDEHCALGSRDASDRLRFPHKLYGRREERAALEAALGRIARKGVELALISGPGGMGKSTLAGTLRKPVARLGGFLAEGKFDPDRRDRPYGGFEAALSGLIDQFLADGSDRVEHWAAHLRAELGAIGAALAELVPLLGALLPELGPVPPLSGKEARERLALAVSRFARAAARTQHPLVLFLDDLQWADAGSLFLLRALLGPEAPESLLVVCGYRDSEVGADHPFARLREELSQSDLPILDLKLQPLELRDTAELLAETLGRSPDQTVSLAQRLGPKSQYNPLLLRRLLFHLWDRDLIQYRHGEGWTWDERRLTEAEITDDAASMVAARIESLPAFAQQLLRIASLVGRTFEVELLVELADADRLDVLQQLMQLVEQGILAPCPEGFKFTHDRLREAAQRGLGADEREALHHRTARVWLERTPDAELPRMSFVLAEHLESALQRLGEAERFRAGEIFHLAAQQALERGSAETADHYARLAVSMLSAVDWRERLGRVYPLAMLEAETALQVGDLERALTLLGRLEERPLDTLQKAGLVAKRLNVFALRGASVEGVRYALAELAALGVHRPLHPSPLRARFELMRARHLLHRSASAEPGAAGGAHSARMLAVHLISQAAGGMQVRVDMNLVVLSVAYTLRYGLRHGFPAPGSFYYVLAIYAMQVLILLGDAAECVRAEKIAHAWARAAEPDPWRLRTEHVLFLFVNPWVMPRHRALEPVGDLVERLREAGEVEFAGYAVFLSAVFRALGGERTHRSNALLEQVDHSFRYDDPDARECHAAYSLLCRPQVTARELERALDESRMRCADESFQRSFSRTIWMMVLCVHGCPDLALAESDAGGAQLLRVTPMVHIADHTFYRGLASAVLAEKTGWLAGCRLRRELRISRARLRRWGEAGPDFAHMSLLLSAESERLRGRFARAQGLYQRAARRAREQGFVNHAALAHERYARLLERQARVREARGAFETAAELYAEWGVPAKVSALSRSSAT